MNTHRMPYRRCAARSGPRRSARTGALLLLVAALAVLLTGCGRKQSQLEGDIEYAPIHNSTQIELEKARKMREMERAYESRAPQKPVDLEPMVPTFNPLDEIPITITMRGETLHNVLYVVARNAGLNLVIEPDISLENTITISFVEAPSSVVVNKLLKAYDLAWEVDDNTLMVQRFQERQFRLDFINSKTEVELDNGGDIYGSASDDSGAGGLEGNFKIESSFGKGNEDDSLYKFLEESIEGILGFEAGNVEDDGQRFVLDPLSGALIVRTSPSKMDAVAKFVTDLKEKMSRQVVIDARILSVRLNDNFSMGIQWNWIVNRIKDWSGAIGWGMDRTTPYTVPPTTYLISDADPAGFTTFSHVNGEEALSATVEALQTFGGVSVISNPHIRTRHGQAALVTSGTTERYISQVDRSTDDAGNVTVTSTVSSAFSGVMLGVYPFINSDKEVDLHIFPIKSDSDLTRTATVGDDTITLPVTDVQNVSTSLKVRDGDTIILGGMIDKDHTDTDQGLPGAMDVPVFGWLFKSKVKTEAVTELVIIMQVRII